MGERSASLSDAKIAVVLPCYNEAAAIATVVADFRQALPMARIIVFDNNSDDATVAEAQRAGAEIRHEYQQGKGYVVRRIFADIDADCILIADGDGTYDAADAGKLVDAVINGHTDMAVGVRKPLDAKTAYRPGHVFGNMMLTAMVRFFFGRGFSDMLSGYRAFSRRFAQSFPITSSGFEIETEITIHCLSLGLPAREIITSYGARIEKGGSKLHTIRDGFRILGTMLRLFKDYRPMLFFSLAALMLAASSLGIALPVVTDYLATGLVERLPTAVLSVGIMLCALLAFVCGLILDSVARQRLEAKKLAYLLSSRSNYNDQKR